MRRLGPIILLVVAVTAVVAIGATGTGLFTAPASMSAGWMLVVRIVGAAIAASGVALLLYRRRRQRSGSGRGSDPALEAVVSAATIMVVLAVLARLTSTIGPAQPGNEDTAALDSVEWNDPSRDRPDQASGGPGMEGGLGLGTAREGQDRRIIQQAESRERDRSWFERSIVRRAGSVLLMVLLLAAAVVGVLALTGRLGRREGEPPEEEPVTPEDAEAGLESSLLELSYEGKDPRGQITAAYRRLLSALAVAGAPREPQEAPHEHLYRTLGPLGVHPEPMHRLTELYVIAQFSERPVLERHRVAAFEALDACLVSLRAANRLADRQPVAEETTA